MSKRKGDQNEGNGEGNYIYRTRSRAKKAKKEDEPAEPVTDVTTLPQGILSFDPKKIDEFLQKLEECTSILILDIIRVKEHTAQQRVLDAILRNVHKVNGLRMCLQEKLDFGIKLLEKARPTLKSLQVSVVRRTRADPQRAIMNLLLNMQLTSLIIKGAFTAKFDAPQQFANSQLKQLVLPTVSSNNQFALCLMRSNLETLRLVRTCDSALQRELMLLGQCPHLSILLVEHFEDLSHVPTLPSKVQVEFRGSKKESADDALNVIVESPQDSVLRNLKYIGIRAQDRQRMHHVLLAIAMFCPNLKGLFLNGWGGDVYIRGILRQMKNLKRLHLHMCKGQDIGLMEDLINSDSLPALTSLILTQTTWARKVSIKLYIDRLLAARPHLKISAKNGEPNNELGYGQALQALTF